MEDFACRYTRETAEAVLLGYYGHLLKQRIADRQGDWKTTQQCRECSGTGARGYDTKNMRQVWTDGVLSTEPTPIPCVVCAGTGTDPTRGFDPISGAPRSETDLAPRWRALVGTALALEIVLVPQAFAKRSLHRLDKNGRFDRSLSAVPDRELTDAEVYAISEFTIAIKLAVHAMAERGWFDPQPLALGLEEGHRLPLSANDGMTEGFKILPEGCKAAEKWVEEHPEAKPPGPEADYGEDAWRLVPQWLRDRYARAAEAAL